MSTDFAVVDVATTEGTADAYLARPTGGGRNPGVLMFMDGFGLRPQLEAMARRLAEQGYVVLAPNLFYRAGRAPSVDLGLLGDPDKRSELYASIMPLIGSLTPDRLDTDIPAYLDYLVANGGEPPIGTVGYCMGGALALRAAALAPDRVGAAASFHGGRLATDSPDSPHRLAPRIRAEVYLGHADDDPSMPPEQQDVLAKALTDAGVTFTAEVYTGARHGFTMADTPVYDDAAAEQHWDRLLDLYERAVRR